MINNSSNVRLCLGIDPNPATATFKEFKECVERHAAAIDSFKPHISSKVMKLQLAFFLSYGSKGIALLEEWVERYKHDFTLILDGKFNEISNSLQAYLNFVFCTLGVHGVTINPYLGENTLTATFETCAKYAGQKGRVYVLCATSESSKSTFSYLQEKWRDNLIACQNARDSVFGADTTLKKCAGVVIGANREDILFSAEVKQSELSILSPGLGVQGGDFHIVKKCENFTNEFMFPLSRSIFNGGSISTEKIIENLSTVHSHF